MNAQMTFQRYELKYLLNAGQKHALLDSMEHYMRPDDDQEHLFRHGGLPTGTAFAGKARLQGKAPHPELPAGIGGGSGIRGAQEEIPVGGLQKADQSPGGRGDGELPEGNRAPRAFADRKRDRVFPAVLPRTSSGNVFKL